MKLLRVLKTFLSLIYSWIASRKLKFRATFEKTLAEIRKRGTRGKMI
jgi:hypothetical protein